MLFVAVCCAGMLAITTLLQFEALNGLSRWLPRLGLPARTKLLVVIGGSFLAHAIEVALDALVLLALVRAGFGQMIGPEALTWSSALNFSTETSTSLGYGDLVPKGAVRLLAGIETLNGLLLIGWSASYLYLSMERFWEPSGSPRLPTGEAAPTARPGAPGR